MKNGFEFDEEIEEIEDTMNEGSQFFNFSEENAFLAVILFCVIALFTFLFMTRKKRASRSFDAQVSTKYRTLSAQLGQQNSNVC